MRWQPPGFEAPGTTQGHTHDEGSAIMAYIRDTTIALHAELAEIQEDDRHRIPTVADLRDLLIAVIENHPKLAGARIRAVDPDAGTITLHGEFHTRSDEGDDK